MTQVEQNKLSDGSNDHKYFIQVPQIVLALCRTPYDYTLWTVVKMVAGESGECTLSTPDLADLAMMSIGKVSDSRAYLVEVGLLEGSCYKDPGYPQQVWHLRVPDLWLKNIEWRQIYDKLKDRIELKQRLDKLFTDNGILRTFNKGVFKVSKVLENVSVVGLHNMKPSQYEGGVPQNERGTPRNERKKNHKEEPSKNQKGAAAPVQIEERIPAPAAVSAYRKVARRFPDKALWLSISETVGDSPEQLEFWEQVIVAWIGCGWNKLNIKGMLSFFKDRRIPTTERSNGTQQGPEKPKPQRTPEQEALIRKYEEESRSSSSWRESL